MEIIIFALLVWVIVVVFFLLLNLHKAKKMNVEITWLQLFYLKSHGVKIKNALFTISSSKDFGVEISPALLVLLRKKGGSICDLVEILAIQNETDEIDLISALEIFLSRVLTGSDSEEINTMAHEFFKWNCCYTGHELPED
ncbi:MAG: hypothetical protein ACSHYA_20000 [Opitutaceae bacterium]